MSYESEKQMLEAIRAHFEDEKVEFSDFRAVEVRLVVSDLATDGIPDYTNRTYYRTVKDHDAGLILGSQWPHPVIEPAIVPTHGPLGA